MRLRRVTLREYVAGLEDANGERLQTREFIALGPVTLRKADDAVWISGPQRTIVVPWTSVLQCEPEAESASVDTDAAQVRAYGLTAEMLEPWVPSSEPVYPNEAEQRTQPFAEVNREPVQTPAGVRSAGTIEQAIAAADAYLAEQQAMTIDEANREVLRKGDVVMSPDDVAKFSAYVAEIQTAHAEVAGAIAEQTPPPPVMPKLSRKERRKRH